MLACNQYKIQINFYSRCDSLRVYDKFVKNCVKDDVHVRCISASREIFNHEYNIAFYFPQKLHNKCKKIKLKKTQ